MAEITCVRCGKEGSALPYAPFNNELGTKIQRGICQECWGAWLARQTMLINHYGLNVRDPEAKTFLLENTENFLFGTGDGEEVDTSRKGTISW